MSDKPPFYSILESFGTRLDKLEKAVIPVHRETKNLQTLQDRSVIIPPRVIIFPRVIEMMKMSPKLTSSLSPMLKTKATISPSSFKTVSPIQIPRNGCFPRKQRAKDLAKKLAKLMAKWMANWIEKWKIHPKRPKE